MRKNYLLSGIAVFLLFLCGTLSTFAALWHYPTERPMDVIFEDGLGTKESPYVIKSAQQLADLSWVVNDGTTYEGQDPMPWGQTVGTDPYPLLNGKGNPETGIVPVIYSGTGKNGGIYDLSGKKVNAPVAKGIYIKDGKKMVLDK